MKIEKVLSLVLLLSGVAYAQGMHQFATKSEVSREYLKRHEISNEVYNATWRQRTDIEGLKKENAELKEANEELTKRANILASLVNRLMLDQKPKKQFDPSIKQSQTNSKKTKHKRHKSN